MFWKYNSVNNMAATMAEDIHQQGDQPGTAVSIIVQQDATIYGFIIFLQTVLHISGDTFTHHQEHM